MRNPVTVLSSLLCVEFVLYTMSLCSPQWLVVSLGVSEGLFALCSSFQGFSSCTTFPAWLGSYSLSWMFLSASTLLSLGALLAVRPALSRGRKAFVALILNIISVLMCVGALVSFLVSVAQQDPELLRHLGWTFYICCASILYATGVTMMLGAVHGHMETTITGAGGGGGGAVVAVSVIAA